MESQSRNFYSLNEKEIKKITKELSAALVSHIEFGNIILQAIILRTDVTEIPKEKGRVLEKWLSAVECDVLLNNDKFLALKRTTGNYKKEINKFFKDVIKKDLYGTDQMKKLITAHEFISKIIVEISTELVETKFQFDSMTGAINRRAFSKMLEDEIDRTTRGIRESSLVFADIDFFKKVNDTYGHDIGDEVLIEFVQILTKSIRTTDIVARWGGEEFLILLEGVNSKKGKDIMDHVRVIIEEQEKKLPSGDLLKYTCSFGITNINKNDKLENVVFRSDKALYKAKGQGRNQVVRFERG